MKYKLWLDDIRELPEDADESWVVIRNVQDAKDYVAIHGVPEFISFDHDLGINAAGNTETSMDFLKWYTNHFNVKFDYRVHSANPVGKANIESYLESYFRSLKS